MLLTMEDFLGKTRVIYTCGECGRTVDGESEHPGDDGDSRAALRHVTGRRSMDKHPHPMCVACLDAWARSLNSDHWARSLEAAKAREMRTGKLEMVFTPHLRGKDGSGLGTWIRSDEHFQVIQKGSRSLRPITEGWKKR